MLILGDENIPFVEKAFGPLGDVRTLSGRAMTPDGVRDADILLVRSVTRVDRVLLSGSRTRFVATATIGFDHVDRDYLASRGIGFAAAPGSNARSVAEYVVTALLALEARGVLRVAGSTLGVVGVGNVGSKVDALARALGMRTLLNDPARARREGAAGFVALDDVCAQADVITFHVPLERGGADPTWHMINAALLGKVKNGVVLLNTSRGAVHDTEALKSAKRSGRIGALALDVFESEPGIDAQLALAADIATPHIAGYSFDGKVAGTRMIHEAACRHLQIDPVWPDGIPPREERRVALARPSIFEAVRASYDIEGDDARLRDALRANTPESRAVGFDRLRKEYPRRREFANWRIIFAPAAEAAREKLGFLGFEVVESGRPAHDMPDSVTQIR
ncbi:MAG: 4-phosphoerythronate dehydrogenase [Vicinamibacteria bacterium]|nr:4-phosphoerythronate dehydrogenase [Vicinamibacteria bacterium]